MNSYQKSYDLDSLLRQRNNENELKKAIEAENFDKSEDHEEEEEKFVIPRPQPFPLFIFDGMHYEIPFELQEFPRLDKWLWNALKFNPTKVMASEVIVFTLVQELMITENIEIGEILLKYVTILPDFFIDFPIWRNFVEEFSISCPDLIIYLLAITRPKIFYQERPDFEDFDQYDVILAIIAVFTCKEITELPSFGYVIHVLKLYLDFTDLDEDMIGMILELFKNLDQIQYITFCTSFPLYKSGLLLINQLSMNVILDYLDSSQVSHPALIKSLNRLSTYTEKNHDKVLIILVLLERYCVSSIILGNITKEMLLSIIESLKFNIGGSIGTMVELKELLQITRVQLSNILEFFTKGI